MRPKESLCHARHPLSIKSLKIENKVAQAVTTISEANIIKGIILAEKDKISFSIYKNVMI